jgi:UDP-sugar pyrophosphorylase
MYLQKAKKLLQESAQGLNPFSDYEATVPAGESLSFDGQGTMSFSEAEQKGIEACAGAVFVLVAGGLGERLGYSGIKLSLETNLCTNKCYLEIYIRYIQAMQHLARLKTGRNDIDIPLVIMTSGDTDPLTRQLLAEHDNFGMGDGLVHIVTQDKVAALKDGSAGLALDEDDRWSVQTKPHGHGDGKFYIVPAVPAVYCHCGTAHACIWTRCHSCSSFIHIYSFIVHCLFENQFIICCFARD